MPCKIFSFSPCHPGLQTQYAREMGNLAICLSIKAQQRRIKWEGKEKEICRQLEIEVFRSLVDILLFRSSWMCCMANSEVAKPVYHCFHSYWCALFIWSAFMHNSVFKSEVSVVTSHPLPSRQTSRAVSVWNRFHAQNLQIWSPDRLVPFPAPEGSQCLG